MLNEQGYVLLLKFLFSSVFSKKKKKRPFFFRVLFYLPYAIFAVIWSGTISSFLSFFFFAHFRELQKEAFAL